jgi:hypothetical protein
MASVTGSKSVRDVELELDVLSLLFFVIGFPDSFLRVRVLPSELLKLHNWPARRS